MNEIMDGILQFFKFIHLSHKMLVILFKQQMNAAEKYLKKVVLKKRNGYNS